MESGYCINCGSAGSSMVLEEDQILHCIQQLTAPLLVQAHDLICITCWTMTQEMIRTTSVSNIGRNCVLCNKTLLPPTRSHQVIALRSDTQHHMKIRNLIIERLIPLKVHASHYICHPCWQRADRAARHYSAPSSSRTTQTASNQLRCANCGINLIRQSRHILTDAVILLQIQQQVSPQVVTANDYICDAFHTNELVRTCTSTCHLKLL